MKIICSIIAGYFLGFLVTYGHAYNTRPTTGKIAGLEYTVSAGHRAIDAFGISVFWPLYLSTIAWEVKP